MTAPLIDPRHLRLLIAVVETGSLSAAARELGFSQSAASQQMKALERTLETPILIRSATGLQLTEAGQVLLSHAGDILGRLKLVSKEVRAITGLETGTVRVVSFPSGSAAIVPKALSILDRDHPGLNLTLNEAEPPTSLERLRAGDCDVAISYVYDHGEQLVDEDGLLALTLCEDSMSLALPRNHRWAVQGGTIPLVALAEERWIAGCPQCRHQLVDTCRAARFEPNIAFETDDYVAVQRLVAEGLGIALLPNLMSSVTRVEEIVRKNVSPKTKRTVKVYTTPALSRVPAVAATIKALMTSAKEL